MAIFFNPFSKKDRDALQTDKGKRGVKIAVVIAVIFAIVIVIGIIM